jgi:predicted transcriptional regulator
MRDENIVKKELIIFAGPQKTGKYVLTHKGEEIVASLMRGEIIGDSTGYPSGGVLEIEG